jgi:hypothetical protein
MHSQFAWRRGVVRLEEQKIHIEASTIYALKNYWRESLLIRGLVLSGVLAISAGVLLSGTRVATIGLLTVGVIALSFIYVTLQVVIRVTDLSDTDTIRYDTLQSTKIDSGGRFVAPKITFVFEESGETARRVVEMSPVLINGHEEFEEAVRVLEAEGIETREMD